VQTAGRSCLSGSTLCSGADASTLIGMIGVPRARIVPAGGKGWEKKLPAGLLS
jgi:hypothetical protein